MKRKTVISIILTIILISASYVSYADEQVTWVITEVTEDTAGNPIEITKYHLYCNNAPVRELTPPNLTHVSTLPAGTYACTATAFAMINGKLVESARSEVASKIIEDDLKPSAPVLSVN